MSKNLLDYVGLGYFLEKIKTLFVTELGTSGDNLTWTKNSETTNIAIPYATEASKIRVLLTKTYENVLRNGTGYTSPYTNSYLYFGSVKTTNLALPSHVKYRVLAYAPSNANFLLESVVEWYFGNNGIYKGYYIWNNLSSTSYYPFYCHTLYSAKTAAIATSDGSYLGCYYGTSTSYGQSPNTVARTIKIEILECNNCTVSLLDNVVWLMNVDNVPANLKLPSTSKAYNDTNFTANNVVTSVGLQETGDANSNTIGYLLRTNSYSKPMKVTMGYGYRLLFTSADLLGWVPANTSTLSNATAARTPCTEPIDPFGEIVYYSGTTAVTNNPGTSSLWQLYTLTLGYSFNTTGAALTLTPWKPVYIKCTPQANGSAILEGYTLDLPTTEDGFIYIYLGVAYSATAVELVFNHPVYYYKNGAVRLWTNELDSAFTTSPAANIASSDITNWNNKVDKVTSTDNAVVKFDGTSGAVLNSGVTINDSNHITATKFITSGGTSSQFVKGNGNLDSTNYAKCGDYHMPTNPFGGSTTAIHQNIVNDGFYAADKRANVTITGFSSGTKDRLFDGDYDSQVIISSGGTGVILIDSGDTPLFETYSYGYTYISFYYTYSPQSVMMRVYGNKSGVTGKAWYDLPSPTAHFNSLGAYCLKFSNSFAYSCTKWEITIIAKSDANCIVTQIDHQFSRGATKYMSAVTKFAIKQDLWGDVEAPKFIKREGTSSQFLKADGSVDSTAYGTYSKPSGGIPKTDLASTVLTSLGKADTALQSFTETDPTVPSWAKASTKPTYTASEVGALPSTTAIPSKTSDLTNDSGFITTSDISGVYKYKGTKTNYSNLPASGNTTGDVWNVTNANGNIPAGTNYAWNGSAWDALGGSVDLSGYVPTSRTINGKALSSNITLSASDVSALPSSTTIPTALADLTDDTTHRLVTDTEKTNWNNKTSNVGTITSVVTTAGAHTTINTTSGSAAFNVPTKTSHLTNDSGFLTSHLNIKTVNGNTLVGTGNVTIPTPNDATLTIKRDGLSLGTFTADSSQNKDIELRVLLSKTFTGVIGTANDQPGATFYFMSVLPEDRVKPCTVKYRIYASMEGLTDGIEESIVTMTFSKNAVLSYDVWNYVANSSYRPYYYHYRYLSTLAGHNSGYGHLVGVGMRYSYNPATAANARTYVIDILDIRGGTVTFFDTMLKFADVPGTGATNYSGESTYDGTSNGETHLGDRNDVNYQNREYYGCRKTNSALYRYMLCLTKSDSSLVPLNSVNGSVATNKTLTTDSFDPFGEILFWNSTTSYAAEANVGDGWYRLYLCDIRYSFNCGGYNTTATLVGRLPLYLVAVPQSNGTAVLHSAPLSLTLPLTEDGLIYIYLGTVYPDTEPYRLNLALVHPIYYYKDSAVRLWTGRSYVAAETDPVFSASAAANITSSNITDWNNKESTSNKVTSMSASSTDSLYPSAKCVYDLVSGISNYIFIEGNDSYNDY